MVIRLGLTKKVCVSLLKNLSDSSTELFTSKGKMAKELLGEDLRLASQVLSRVCEKDSLGELFAKFSIDRDPQCPMKLWSDNVMEELKEVYSCRTLSGAKKEMLRSTLSYIRQVEKSWEFQQELWDEKETTMKKYGLASKDALTYGSTSFTLWRDVVALPCVQEALHPAKKPKVAILGSSQGLLALYTDALCNSFVRNTGGDHVTIEGWEIQPCLHEVAEDIIGNVSGDVGHVSVHLEDMFEADLSGFVVVVLTSLCWDNQTRLKIAKKLSRELQAGALVVDYQEGTFKDFALDATSSLYGDSSGGSGGEKEGGEEDEGRAAKPASVKDASIDQLSKALDDGLADAIEAFWNGEELVVSPPSPQEGTPKKEKGEDKNETVGTFKVESLTEGTCSWSNQQTIYIHKKQ